MITLTKEWLLKTISELEEERDSVPGAVNEDAAMALAAMKLALESLEAEKERKHHSVIAEQLAHVLSGLDATDHQRAVISCAIDRLNNVAEILQRSPSALPAPPAPVSVPDAMEMDDDFDSAFEHGKAVGWNACRAAMLQGADVSLTHEGKNHHEDKLGMVHHLGDANEKGNSPVIPDGWVACSERMPEQFKAILAFNEYGEVWSGAYDRYWNFYCDNLLVEHVTHWMPLPAAPQQEDL